MQKSRFRNIIPGLREWTEGSGVFTIGSDACICVDPLFSSQLTSTAKAFQKDIKLTNGRVLQVVHTTNPSAGDFYLTLDCAESKIGSEGYLLQISSHAAIRANSDDGIFYGTQTILQLLKQDSEKSNIPAGSVRDYPAYPFRGLMIDVARKFMPVSYLKGYIRLCTWHKMNIFHIHFSDDSAFRLVSDTYPGLAPEIDSYTKSDIQVLVEFADQYHITIVPEIDIPSHASAMLRYCPELRHADEPLKSLGLLNLGPKYEDSKNFVINLINEFAPCFPGPYFHIGADEYPHLDGQTDYAKLEQCKELVDWAASTTWHKHGNTYPGAMYRRFLNDINIAVRNTGKTARMWDWYASISGSSDVSVDSNIAVDQWRSYKLASITVNANHDIVNCGLDMLYVVPGDTSDLWLADHEWLYSQWAPWKFDKYDKNILSPTDPHLKGAKLQVWLNNDEPSFETIDNEAKPSLLIVADRVWGGPLLVGGYCEFQTLANIIGEPPMNNG